MITGKTSSHCCTTPPHTVGQALPFSRRSCAGLLVLLIAFCFIQPLATAQEPAPVAERPAPPAPLPVTLRPYQVQVLISFQSDASFPAAIQNRLAEQTAELLQSRFRQMWNLKIDVVASLPIADQALADLSDSRATTELAARAQDKVFLVEVSTSGGSIQVACREWDASSQSVSSLYEAETFDRRELAAVVCDTITSAFRPLAELEVLDDYRIEFLVRAGELFPADPALAPFQPGDYLVPFLRYLDRKGELRMIQSIPWSYLKVDRVQRSRLVLSLVSTFRAPLPKTRRRMEVVALRIRPHLASTEIRVAPRGNLTNPLVGTRCELLNREATEADPVDDRLKLITDRRGIVTLPVDPKHPLQYLHIYSGQALLARVPVIPGNVPNLQVEVPDDRARLNVEGEVSLLQTELIDIVATREVLMSRARAAASQGKWSDVDRFLEELNKLPTLRQFNGRIETLQVQAVYQAQQAKDRVAEARIKRLCEGVKSSAERHLNPLRITEFRNEINLGRPK